MVHSPRAQPRIALRRASTAARECLEHCRKCSRCRHISVSLKFRDCSWFEKCPQPLRADVPSFRSGLALTSEAAAGSAVHGTPTSTAIASSSATDPSSSGADSAPCFVALGIMSAPGMHERRQASRSTWMRHCAPGVKVRFLLRASSLRDRKGPAEGGRPRGTAAGKLPWGGATKYSSGDLQRVAKERRQHGDLVILQVDAGPELHPKAYQADVLRGRVLTLQAWLRVGRRRFPTARYIAKADDDGVRHIASHHVTSRLSHRMTSRAIALRRITFAVHRSTPRYVARCITNDDGARREHTMRRVHWMSWRPSPRGRPIACPTSVPHHASRLAPIAPSRSPGAPTARCSLHAAATVERAPALAE